LLSLRESRRPFLGCSAFLWNCIGSLSPLLSLSRSLGGHVWNHLVSQKTWQNNQECKCNVRSAKRGERRGAGEANIQNNVQACNLKSSAQKVSQQSAPRLQFGGPNRPQMPPKGSLGDPLDAPWTALGSLRGSVERSGGSWDALWSSSGDRWSSSGPLWVLWVWISELSGTILGAFWYDFEAFFLSLLRVLWKPASSSVLVVLGTFWCTSFAKFAKWRDRSRLVNTN